MTRSYLRAAAIVGVASLITACSGGALNQNLPSAGQAGSQPSIALKQQSHPINVEHRYTGSLINTLQTGALPTWNGSFTYNGHTYNYTMVGANPASNNSTTTIPVTVIPLKIVIGKTIFSPNKKLSIGRTVLANILDSPLFKSNVDFVQGGTDLGMTQYEDAFQRGNFWSSVSTNTNYHLILKPTVAAVQTLKPGSLGSIGNEFGAKVGLVPYNYMDGKIQGIVSAMNIPPGTLPLFVTRNVYETSGGCCIGGWHNFNGTNTYSIATYVDKPGAFSQDVSAFSHELGEWIDDPYINNGVACGILEVGDPLEGNPNYGGYPYTVNGFTYNLQDLVFLPYFGAPPSTSVNDFFTFQGEKLGVCQNGG
ncbi:MAG: hypothetical protein JOY69_07675 [Candidatus Eremiobacteraeota bacterium]|nr:hypothetical protein [Candidatus Eremiobacteraeota bacterium]